MDRSLHKRPRIKLDHATYRELRNQVLARDADGAKLAGPRKTCKRIICGLEVSWVMMCWAI